MYSLMSCLSFIFTLVLLSRDQQLFSHLSVSPSAFSLLNSCADSIVVGVVGVGGVQKWSQRGTFPSLSFPSLDIFPLSLSFVVVISLSPFSNIAHCKYTLVGRYLTVNAFSPSFLSGSREWWECYIYICIRKMCSARMSLSLSLFSMLCLWFVSLFVQCLKGKELQLSMLSSSSPCREGKKENSHMLRATTNTFT